MTEMPTALVFSKTPACENSKTRLHTSSGLSRALIQRLHRAFIEDTLAAVESSICSRRVLSWAPPVSEEELESLKADFSAFEHQLQVGEGFAERFDTALLEQQSEGGVLIVGTDCPLLTAEIIDQAAQAVRSGEMAIGPSPSGGFYLLGVPANLELKPFSEFLEFSSELVGAVSLHRGEAKCTVLPFLPDIDVADDLITFLELARASDLAGRVPSAKTLKACASLRLVATNDNRERKLVES